MSGGGPRGLKRIGLSLAWLLCLGCEGGDRSAELERAAQSLGLGFSRSLPPDVETALREVPSIKLRARNYLANAVIAEDAIFFDWTWRKAWVKDRTVVKQTVVAIRLRERALPAFAWAERGQLSRPDLRELGGALDFGDVPEFSDQYEVAGQDRAGIRMLFSASEREQLKLPAGMRVDGSGEWLIGYRPGELVSPAEIERSISDLHRLADSL